jgi:hypothetical protein
MTIPINLPALARALLLTVTAVLAACGGGGDSGVAPPPVDAPSTGKMSVVGGTEGIGPAVATDSVGNLFYSVGSTVLKRNATGSVTPASPATFEVPLGIAADGSGNVFVVERGPSVFGLYALAVRRIDTLGNVTTVGGKLPGAGVTLGIAPPIAVGPDGGFYVSALGTLRKVLPDETVVNVTAPEVRRIIDSIAVDSRGNVYFGHDNMVKVIAPGQAEVVLAQGLKFGADGGSMSQDLLSGLAVDSVGNVYVANNRDHTIRKISPGGVVTTIAGQPDVAGLETGPLPGKLTAPRGLALHGDKTLYVTTQGILLRIDLP